MKTKSQILKLGGNLIKLRSLEKQVDARKQLTGGWLSSSSGTASDGKPSITVEIKLSVYLDLFEETKPKPVCHEWTTDDGTRKYMSYPSQFLGTIHGTHVFCDARTDSVLVPLAAESNAAAS